MNDDIDIMGALLAGHVLENADASDAVKTLEDFLSGQSDDPTVFDDIEEGLHDED